MLKIVTKISAVLLLLTIPLSAEEESPVLRIELSKPEQIEKILKMVERKEDSFWLGLLESTVPIVTTGIAALALYLNYRQNKQKLIADVITSSGMENLREIQVLNRQIVEDLLLRRPVESIKPKQAHLSIIPHVNGWVKEIISIKIEASLYVLDYLLKNDAHLDELVSIFETFTERDLAQVELAASLVSQFEASDLSSFSQVKLDFINSQIDALSKNRKIQNQVEGTLQARLDLKGRHLDSIRSNIIEYFLNINARIEEVYASQTDRSQFSEVCKVYSYTQGKSLRDFLSSAMVTNLSASFSEYSLHHWKSLTDSIG